MTSTRAFYDIAQLLESAADSNARVARVLARLRSLVPYDRCAVLEVRSGERPRLVTPPGTSAAEHDELASGLLALFRGLGTAGGPSEPRAPEGSRQHLALPLIGLDQTLGVLFVDRAAESYEERHVRALSVIAANLAAYFSLLRALELEAARTEELLQAKRAADAAELTKNEFLALVSHELRSPLNSILVWSDALRSTSTSDAERRRAVEAIERAVGVQAKLVSDLLDLSCIAASSLRLEVSLIQPAQVVAEALSPLRLAAKQNGVELEVWLDESMPSLVVDPRRLSQVVVSLVANAIKFTPAGGHVEVRLDQSGPHARIRVSDTGLGIDARALPGLFENFRLGDGSTTRAQGGLGVGLALVKHLVALHGGRVRVESAGERNGSQFTVELPLAGPAATAPSPDLASAKLDRPGTLSGIRVLLVDDDRDIGEVLKFVLESQGALVSLASSAADALAALNQSRPDVLLSDLAMPGGSGYELMRNIAARQGMNAPPAAALSAYAPGQDLREALAAGFRMLLEKPIDPAVLIASVATLAREANSKLAAPLRVERALVD
ncbi:MAG TPA: hybrid sensor histidine kinase/response regulator [Polyangiaceae bacterium]|nr:hybrid sensor histidine kinase/response regulator [Polyangiaceae bacterium]